MANPQKENGYTAIANEILEHLPSVGLDGSEWDVLSVIFRFTYGFQKKADWISLGMFAKYTKIGRNNIPRIIRKLVSRRILVKDKKSLFINKNWEEWVVSRKILVSPTIAGAITHDSRGAITGDTDKRKKKRKETKERILATSQNEVAEGEANKPERVRGEIEQVFDIFYESINPQINFGNRTMRAAAEDLIKRYGIEKAVGFARAAVAVHGKKFAPVITTPYQLKEKLSALAAFYKTRKARKIAVL